MEKNYFEKAAEKIKNNDIFGAIEILNDGAIAYAKHIEEMLNGIDSSEAGLILAVMRPAVAVLDNMPGARKAEKLINGFFNPQVLTINKPVDKDDEREGEK